jgi:predicted permease
MLLILAGHIALQVTETQRAEHGYPTADVLTARIGLFEGTFPSRDGRLAFYGELVRRLENRPGVIAASLTTTLPGTEGWIWRAAIQGHDYAEVSDIPSARIAYVSPEFFDAFQMPLIQGRPFTANDAAGGSPVAIVNQPFVDRFLSGQDPVGRQVRLGWPEPEGPWRTVVGVAPDMDLDGAMQPEGNPEGVYLPVAQTDARFMSVAVRTRGAPLAFASTLREEVTALQGDTPIYFVRTLRDAINSNLLDILLVGSLIWAVALAAFLLASVGLYGVTAFLATQRTRELGVRLALGAKAGDVLRLIARQGAGQIAVGLIVGVLLAAGLMAVMASGGLEMVPWSTFVTGIVCLVLAITGLFAVCVPAWRAAGVDPVEAFRTD